MTCTISSASAAVDILEATVVLLARVGARAILPLDRARMIEYDIAKLLQKLST